MKLPSKAKFFDEKIKKAFEELQHGKGDEKQLYDWLIRAFTDIEANHFALTADLESS